MKMQFSFWLKETFNFQTIAADSEKQAFQKACEKFGPNSFTDFQRYYPKQRATDHKLSFIKRSISNVVKHQHQANRRGFKK